MEVVDTSDAYRTLHGRAVLVDRFLKQVQRLPLSPETTAEVPGGGEIIVLRAD